MRVSDEKIIAALLNAGTNKAAAEAVGLSETQLYARMRKDAFKAKLADAKRRVLESATVAAQGRLGEAVATMADIMGNAENSPQVRLNAADALLRNSLKLTEQTDILERVGQLEKAVGEWGQ